MQKIYNQNNNQLKGKTKIMLHHKKKSKILKILYTAVSKNLRNKPNSQKKKKNKLKRNCAFVRNKKTYQTMP